MKYIIRYKNFNESKGISDSCEKVMYMIWNIIENDILNFNSNNIICDINEPDFKVKELKIDFKIDQTFDSRCDVKAILKGSSIMDDNLINSYIELNIKIDEIDDEFIYYMKSVLLHEIVHLFQHYNILKGEKFRPESFSIGSILSQLRTKLKTNYSNYLLDIIYFSLQQELSSQLHQYYFYKVNNKNYEKIDKIINLLNNFKIDINDDISKDINFIKYHIKNSIEFYSKNNKYLHDVNKSVWVIKDNDLFLNKLKSIIDERVEWVRKKIRLIDSKIEDSKIIRYDEYISLPTNWEDHEVNDAIEYQKFIEQNLNDYPRNFYI